MQIRKPDVRLSEHPTSRRRVLAGAGLAAAGGVLGGLPASAQDATPNAVATPAAVDTGTIGGVTVDPEMQAVLDALVSFQAPPLATVDPQVARNLPSFADALRQVLTDQGKPTLEEVSSVTHILIPGPAGQILGRVYRPAKSAMDDALPLIVYYHGGGFVIADLNTYDASPRALANAANAVVVSIAYRQAPENPFPAAVDDSYAAFQYLAMNASVVNADASKVAVAGESAGGNLATVVCLRARDQGGAMPVHQLLVYPVATFAPEGEAKESTETFADAIPLSTPALQWFGKHYLPDPSSAANPEVSPLNAADLSGLPPATVIAAEIDPLLSQGKVYADALEAAGVATDYHLYKGVTHEFFGMGAAVAVAKEAMDQAAKSLKATFGG